MVDGFEKLTLSDYKWSTFKEVKQRVANISSGLVDLAGIKPGDKVVIYADTKMVGSHTVCVRPSVYTSVFTRACVRACVCACVRASGLFCFVCALHCLYS